MDTDKIIKPGRLFFAVALAAIGAENLICAHFSEIVFANHPPAVPVLPFVPPLPILVYLVGLALFAAGLCMAVDFRARSAAILAGLFFLLCVVVLYAPKAVAAPRDLNVRTCFFEGLALAAAALTLAGGLQRDNPGSKLRSAFAERAIDKLIGSAPYLFAVSSMVFGVTHFLVPQFIASLIPAWIPAGMFWAYLTGAGFIAAGLSIATGIGARWGALWLGIMFLLWFLFLHTPRVAIHPRIPAEWSSAFIALGLGGGSWICAWHFRRSQATGSLAGAVVRNDGGISR